MLFYGNDLYLKLFINQIKPTIMSTTTENIQNYFDALEKLYTSSLETYKSTLSDDWDGFKAKVEAKFTSIRLKKAMEIMEKNLIEQQNRLENLDTKEFHKEVLVFMDNLEEVIEQGVVMVKERLAEQKAYVRTDEFLVDTK